MSNLAADSPAKYRPVLISFLFKYQPDGVSKSHLTRVERRAVNVRGSMARSVNVFQFQPGIFVLSGMHAGRQEARLANERRGCNEETRQRSIVWAR